MDGISAVDRVFQHKRLQCSQIDIGFDGVGADYDDRYDGHRVQRHVAAKLRDAFRVRNDAQMRMVREAFANAVVLILFDGFEQRTLTRDAEMRVWSCWREAASSISLRAKTLGRPPSAMRSGLAIRHYRFTFSLRNCEKAICSRSQDTLRKAVGAGAIVTLQKLPWGSAKIVQKGEIYSLCGSSIFRISRSVHCRSGSPGRR
jgi:hypothetical protein